MAEIIQGVNPYVLYIAIFLLLLICIMIYKYYRKILDVIFGRSPLFILRYLLIIFQSVPFIPLAGRLWRWLFDSWRRPLLDFIMIIAVIIIISNWISPLDPAGLDYRMEKINNSDLTRPTFEELLETVLENFTSNKSFKKTFADETVFAEMMKNDSIFSEAMNSLALSKKNLGIISDSYFYDKISKRENYYASFNNSSIIETLLGNPSLKSILQNKSCSMIYCDNKEGCDWCEEITENEDNANSSEINNSKVNLSILKEYVAENPINRDKTLLYLYRYPTLKTHSIRIISNNTTLKNIACLQLALFDSDSKDMIIETLNDNITLKNEALEAIFSDDVTRETVIAIVASDRDLQDRLFKPPFSLRNSLVVLLWNYWLEVLIIWVIYEVLLWGRRLSRSMAINDFIDESGEISEKEKKPLAKGLGPQLVAKLNWIYHIYDQIDEHRSLSTVALTDMPSSAAIKADEVISILGSGEILDATSKLPLGLIAMPQKLINDLANFIFKHPSITGTLHKQSIEGNDAKFLTARMVSKKRPLSWRVEGKDEQAGPWDPWDPNSGQSKTPEAMIDELAYQIFADLAFPSRMVSWKAVRSFSEGLRRYRRCLRNEMDKDLSLQEAESFFLQATSEDQEFAWAYYNLGVVYTEMDEPQAAHQAFSKAREINPGAWQIHYALALNLFRCNSDSQEVIALCEKAFNLHPNFSDSSRILKLKGLAYKRLNDGKKSENSLKRASFFAIFALAGAYFHEDDVLNKRVLLSKCLQDLAKCHETADGNGVKEDLLKKAYSITPEDLNLWCDLAIYQKSISKKELDVRCKAIIDNYWDSTPGDLKRLANYNGLKELGYSDSLNKLARYRSQIESRSTADRSIEAKEPCYLDDIQRLNYARWALFLAERATTTDERENAINKIKIIINYLEESIQKNTESKVANYFWISLILCDLAQCYNKYNRLAMDLTTEVAKKDYFNKDIDIVEFLSDQNNEINIGNTKLNVEDFRESKRSFPHAYRHMVKRLSKKLDDIKAHSLFTDDKKRDFIKHFENNDYQLAKETLLKALMLDPNDPIIRYNLGVAYVREGFSLGDKSAIKRNMEIGNRYLTQSLELSKTKKNNMEIRYWLGVLYCQIREFEKAVSNFNICKSMSKEVLTYDKEAEFERWQVYLMLGDTYLRQKRYDDCEEELRKITEYLKEGDKIQEKACKYFDKKNNKEILIYAYLWLALIYLEKQIDLYKADQFIEKAKEQISSLNINESANEFKRNLERNLYACIGWKMLLQAQGIGIDLRKIDIDNKKKEVILHKGDIRDCDLTYDNGDKKYKFKKAQIRNAILSVDEKYIDVLNAEVSDATIEAADERARFKGLIDGNTIVPSNYGKYNFADLTEEKYKIKKAVEFESVKLVGSIEDIIQNVASLNSDPPLSMINESIFWLEESLALASDPQTCLLLAQALEVKLGLTSDAQVKDAITKKIRARCLLAIQLDIMDDYKQEIETISKKYEEKNEKKEEVKDKATPTSTISLSIEGTAKGDLTTKADSAKAK